MDDEMVKAQDRIRRRWTEIRRGLQNAEAALKQLAEEQQKWDNAEGLFPMDMDAVKRYEKLASRVASLHGIFKRTPPPLKRWKTIQQ